MSIVSLFRFRLSLLRITKTRIMDFVIKTLHQTLAVYRVIFTVLVIMLLHRLTKDVGVVYFSFLNNFVHFKIFIVVVIVENLINCVS